ncbi:MAG: acetate--CoA ligase family protein, partial [Pseudomonadota bacterium]
RLLALAGLDLPRFKWATKVQDAVYFASEIGYPVVAKIVSSKVIHKSDVGGVVTGIDDDIKLKDVFSGFACFDGFAGMLVEEMLSGLELIVGAKMDYQFGPVILLGIGGTGVEIYRDTTMRMAPLSQNTVESMVKGLKARPLIEGYRGSEPINLKKLTRMMIAFSDMVMDLEGRIESIDLNPVICSSTRCVVADARIMLS